ncbi:FAD-dependent monooxygenase [Streptomyces qinzhouensis]|uniref:2-polyprenyl-6-methoxyphenol hydroxylase n=1 Tax=Streptomyces qinzhouensis TaxID=2599401 RepID=A0A5B8IBU0_9ACTN|nr:FAD-dependent monooxygenase [Streptomyces qinzhouensis]QDY75618.1 2-polyprenyl-6-methoxyphenol hydroxylase [Streptomyces qinzhouensis]
MPEAEDTTEVLIVGGGPVGLTARALLDRWGIRTLLAEKHRTLSPFPRARLVNVRSMEIFRLLGLDGAITAVAFPPEYGRIRFRDTLLEPDFATAAMVGINGPVPESPAVGAVTSQDRLEPVLLAAADAPVRFGAELTGFGEEPGGVVARLADRDGGAETRIRARYVLAADGARSTVRRLFGIGTTGPGTLGSFTTVVFDADLGPWCADRPAGVYFTAHGLFAPVHPEGDWAWFVPTPDGSAGADWTALVTDAIGGGSGPRADIVRVQHWDMNAFVAERFRHGRVLLAGDAVHALPIVGGLGMNTGLADVHNLCWKLAGTLRGWAGPGLVDSYAAERRPVALRTLEQAVAHTRLLLRVQNERSEQRAAEADPGPLELPWSEEYFAQLGLILGMAYRSGAVLADEVTPAEPADPGTDYVPTTEPGHRMPHLPLTAGRSVLDSFGEWFTLLTPGPVSGAPPPTAPWPLRTENLPAGPAGLPGLGPRGALLVRPDGHIGARWRAGPPDGAALRAALAAITDRTPPPPPD